MASLTPDIKTLFDPRVSPPFREMIRAREDRDFATEVGTPLLEEILGGDESDLYTSPDVDEAPYSLRMFAQSQGDKFISGTGAEGAGPIQSARYYAHWLSEVARFLPDDSGAILGVVGKLKAISERGLAYRAHPKSEYADRLMAEVDASEDSVTYYYDLSIHCIALEIKKEADDRYTFAIYNGGTGLDFHPRHDQRYKPMYDPKLLFTNIPRRKIHHLLALAFEMHDSKNCDRIFKVLYHLIGRSLSSHQVVDERVGRFKQPQNAGTCALMSLKSYIAYQLDPAVYKRVWGVFKWLTADRFFRAHLREMAEHNRPVTCEIFQEVLANIARRLCTKMAREYPHGLLDKMCQGVEMQLSQLTLFAKRSPLLVKEPALSGKSMLPKMRLSRSRHSYGNDCAKSPCQQALFDERAPLLEQIATLHANFLDHHKRMAIDESFYLDEVARFTRGIALHPDFFREQDLEDLLERLSLLFRDFADSLHPTDFKQFKKVLQPQHINASMILYRAIIEICKLIEEKRDTGIAFAELMVPPDELLKEYFSKQEQAFINPLDLAEFNRIYSAYRTEVLPEESVYPDLFRELTQLRLAEFPEEGKYPPLVQNLLIVYRQFHRGEVTLEAFAKFYDSILAPSMFRKVSRDRASHGKFDYLVPLFTSAISFYNLNSGSYATCSSRLSQSDPTNTDPINNSLVMRSNFDHDSEAMTLMNVDKASKSRGTGAYVFSYNKERSPATLRDDLVVELKRKISPIEPLSEFKGLKRHCKYGHVFDERLRQIFFSAMASKMAPHKLLAYLCDYPESLANSDLMHLIYMQVVKSVFVEGEMTYLLEVEYDLSLVSLLEKLLQVTMRLYAPSAEGAGSKIQELCQSLAVLISAIDILQAKGAREELAPLKAEIEQLPFRRWIEKASHQEGIDLQFIRLFFLLVKSRTSPLLEEEKSALLEARLYTSRCRSNNFEFVGKSVQWRLAQMSRGALAGIIPTQEGVNRALQNAMYRDLAVRCPPVVDEWGMIHFNDEMRILMQNGLIMQGDQIKRNRLSSDARQQILAQYANLFPDLSEIKIFTSEFDFAFEYKGHEFLVTFYPNQLFLKIDGKLAKYLPAHKFFGETKTFLNDPKLAAFQLEEGATLFYDIETLTPHYSIEESGRLFDHYKEESTSIIEDPVVNGFDLRALDEQGFILQNEMGYINFTRYGVLMYETQEGLELDGHPGYYLSPIRLPTEFKDFDDYLLFQKREKPDEFLIVIPSVKATIDKRKELAGLSAKSFHWDFDDDCNYGENSRRLSISYFNASKAEITPLDGASGMQLAYTFALVRNYKRAMELLRASDWDDAAPSVIDRIISLPEAFKINSPGGLSVAALALLRKLRHEERVGWWEKSQKALFYIYEFLPRVGNFDPEATLSRLEELNLIALLDFWQAGDMGAKAKLRKSELQGSEFDFPKVPDGVEYSFKETESYTIFVGLNKVDHDLFVANLHADEPTDEREINEMLFELFHRERAEISKDIAFWSSLNRKVYRKLQEGDTQTLDEIRETLILLNATALDHYFYRAWFFLNTMVFTGSIEHEHERRKIHITSEDYPKFTMPSDATPILDKVSEKRPLSFEKAPVSLPEYTPHETFCAYFEGLSACRSECEHPEVDLSNDPFIQAIDGGKYERYISNERYRENVARDLMQLRESYVKEAASVKNPYVYDPSAFDLEWAIKMQSEIQEKLTPLHSELLHRANRGLDPLELLSKVQPAVELTDLIEFVLTGNRITLTKINPYLEEDDAEVFRALYQQTMDVLSLTVASDHLADLIRDHGSRRKFDQLISQMQDPIPHPRLLAQMYMHRVRPFTTPAPQKELLEKMTAPSEEGDRYASVALQAPCGGGKSSVLLPFAAEEQCRDEKIPLLIIPKDQYLSYLGLRKSKRSHSKIETFNYSRDELTIENLNGIDALLDRIQQGNGAYDEKAQLVLTKEMVKTLALEWFSVWAEMHSRVEPTPRAGAGGPDPKISEKRQDLTIKEDSLCRILTKLLNTEPIADEGHVVFDILNRVNFPFGMPTRVETRPAELLEGLVWELYSIEEVKLACNDQSYLTEEVYKKSVIPQLINSVIPKFPIPDEYGEIYREFLCGKCPKDHPFNGYLEELNKRDKEKADMIAFASHIILELFPSVLKSTCKINFGPSGDEVRPYSAANTPSDTYFGYWAEAYCYYLFTGLQREITRPMMVSWIEEIKEQANFACVNSGGAMDIDQTEPGKVFKELTGIELSSCRSDKKIDEALMSIQSSDLSSYRFMSYLAKMKIKIYPSYLSASGILLVQIMRSMRTTSGSIGPVLSSFHRSLCKTGDSEIAMRDAARMLFRLFDHADLHVLDDLSPEAVLTQILEKKQIHAVADAGGVFRDCSSNLAIARQFISVIEENTGPQQAIFFFDNDQPSLLFRSDGEPIPIATPSAEEYAKFGLTPEDVFTFYDSKHCYGTDCPLPPDCEMFVLLDRDLTRSQMGQVNLRERGYFFGQKVTVGIPRALEKTIPGFDPKNVKNSLVDIALLASVKQVESSVDKSVTAIKEMQNAIFQGAAFLALLKGEGSKEVYELFKNYIKVDNPKDLFATHGRPSIEVETKEFLHEHLRKKKEKFLEEVAASSIDAKLRDELVDKYVLSQCALLEEHLETLHANHKLPAKVPAKLLGPRLGDTIRATEHIQEDLKLEVKLAVEREVENLLERYNGEYETTGAANPIAVEEVDAAIEGTLEKIAPLSSAFEEPEYQRYFEGLPIFVTDDFIEREGKRSRPLFSKLSKRFDQLVLMQNPDESYKLLCLSAYEMVNFKERMRQNPNPKVWILSDGGSVLWSAGSAPNSDAKNALLAIANLIGGKMSLATKNILHAQKWLDRYRDDVTFNNLLELAALSKDRKQWEIYCKQLKDPLVRERTIARLKFR
ncbi:MAG: hypothetical protein MRY21_02910 [Simkaniaceae bacterium]|nr:hypothetical protein [Simkaniaceae bacterium]